MLRNSKYFDKEMMEDAIPACKGRGADPKAIRLWHKLNDKTEICVKTGVGLTEYTEVGQWSAKERWVEPSSVKQS